MPPRNDNRFAGKPPLNTPTTDSHADETDGVVQNPPSETDPATTIFTLPQFELADLMPRASGKLLDALKRQLGQLTVEKSNSGIRHQNGRYAVLPRTLRSAWIAKVNHSVLGKLRFLMGQTRSTWIVVYDTPHERIYEDPRFMSIELKATDVTTTPKGKKMYVSRIGNEDVVKINAIAAQDTGLKARPDSLAPTEGAFSREETLARLKRCAVVHSDDPDFDVAAFTAAIRFITPTQGPAGNYYYLDVGDAAAPTACELYVVHDPELSPQQYRAKTILAYKNELSYLYTDLA
jgi:hypothetical protein